MSTNREGGVPLPIDLTIALQRRAAANSDAMTTTIAVLLFPLTMCVFSILLAMENPTFASCLTMLAGN